MRMSVRWLAGVAIGVSALGLARLGSAQPKDKDQVLPPADNAPRLVLSHAGPHAPVNALAFAPDGSALYVAGFDKQVRRYKLADGAFVPDGTFRVPIGPGNGGVINALAVSPDGKWVAAAGRAPIRGEVWSGADDGVFADYRFISPDMRGDAGIVYLFDPIGRADGRAIRGQLGEVRALAFADPAPASGPVLVTAGIERDERGDYRGALRVFDADGGKPLARHLDLPPSDVPPGLAAFATGPGNKGLRVALAWDAADDRPGKLLVWDDPAPGRAPALRDDLARNSTLAVRFDKGAVAELVTGGYDFAKRVGGLTVRGPDGAAARFDALAAEPGEAHLPVGLAAVGPKGTAVLTRVVSAAGRRHELRVLAPGGAAVVLDGLNEARKPVLAASPDGRFVAVGGFLDNRVDVHDVAALAAGKARAQRLASAEPGFAKVAFLDGERLWLGKHADTTAKGGGGAILDLGAKVRAAAPRGANEELALDAPGAPAVRIVAGTKGRPWSVAVTVGGAEKTIVLPAGEEVTAAAALTAKMAWDEDLGPVVAIAHRHVRSQDVGLALYALADSKVLYRFGGPTLPVRSLAFSRARPLLAGAGDDGTAAVWSLKGVSRPMPVIEGLLVTVRDGKVVVASVQKGSAADGKLAADDVVESVVDGAGNVQPLKAAADFVQAVRTLKVGAEAQITANKKPVAVKVGTAIGFRQPLFDLWVDPVPKDGKHAWVGWTSSGPYDASGEDGEGRIGWLTATGRAARPVTFAGVEQYRRLFYWRDFIRQLLVTGDYRIAHSPPQPPKLRAAFPAAIEHASGRSITREKIDAQVTLSDPDRVLDTSRAVLLWQVVSPDGTSEWVREPFGSGQAVPKLTGREWKRGPHTVRAKLFANAADAAPVLEAAAAVEFVPPAPEFAVRIDGKAIAPGDRVTAANDKDVKVSVDPKFAAGTATAKVSWTGGKEVELGRDPVAIPLSADELDVTVTATNAGADPKSADETYSIPVRVLRPKVVPKPVVALGVLDPFDARPNANDPYVVSAEKVRVRVTVTDAEPVVAFEWRVGNGRWTAEKLAPDPTDAKTGRHTLIVDLTAVKEADLNKDGNVELRVRATGKGGVSESVLPLRYDGLPEISVDAPPPVTGPELKLRGGLKVTSKRKFAVRVRVTSSRTGQTREFAPSPNPELTRWTADLTLFPGENKLGYVVRYDSGTKEQLHDGLVAVNYSRPPVALGASALELGTGGAGRLAVAVAAPGGDAPELLVGGAPVGARTTKGPLRVFGAPLWALTASGVPAAPGADRLKPVSGVVRGTEGASAAVPIEVNGVAPVVVAPPTIALAYSGGPIAHGAALAPTSDPNFAFDLRVRSGAPLTRVEVWHGPAPGARLERLDGVGAAGGTELDARPGVRLRPGPGNYVKVVASNAGHTVEVGFSATYTPLPVQVVVESIREPNGAEVAVTRDSAGRLQVDKGVIEVKGRVEWINDDEPVATDAHLAVAFVANGVAHVPVLVSKAAPGEGRVRRFSGRVYLNSSDPTPNAKGTTHVRAELRSGLRAVPQVGAERAALTVTSKAPVTRQRLHVLVFGVGVPEADQGKLVRGVITAIGGKIPADSPNFTEGRFERDRFEFAQLYRPQFANSQSGHLNAMLNRVRADIARRSSRPGDDEWVNDVVLLYYQGADWRDASGRWLLHTATTVGEEAGPAAADEAIRPDNLPPIPGMLVVVANVTGAPMTADPLAVDVPYLRYAWSDREAAGTLLGALERAVKAQRKVDEIRRSVDAEVEALKANATRFLPPAVLDRIVGLK